MGDKVIKRPLSEMESLSFSTSQTSFIGDNTLSDNQKLWDYIRSKRNYNVKQDNFVQVISQGLHKPKCDVRVEICDVKGVKIGGVEKQVAEKEQYSNMEINNFKKPENRVKPPPKRRASVSLRRTTRSLEKRLLLNEFEKTLVQENQFNPKCVSTPICKNIIQDKDIDNDILALKISPMLGKNDDEIVESTSDRSSIKRKNEVSKIDISCQNKSLHNSKNNSTLNNHECSNHQNNCLHRIKENESFRTKTVEPLSTEDRDFTIIPNTQENQNENDCMINNESVCNIPETQESKENEKTLLPKSKVSNTVLNKEKNCEILKLKENKSLETCNNILKSSCIAKECQRDLHECCNLSNKSNKVNRISDIQQYPENAENINCLNHENMDYPENNLIKNNSTNRDILNMSDKKSAVERRTYTICRKSSNMLSDINNTQINENDLNGQNQDDLQLENEEFENEYYLNYESFPKQRRLLDIAVKSPAKFTSNDQNIENKILKSPSKIYPNKYRNRVSKIPQFIPLASSKPINAFNNNKPSEFGPKIISVRSLAEKVKYSNNHTNLATDFDVQANNSLNNKNKSNLDVIVDRLQKSAVFIMIDNKGNKNNETITKQNSKDTNNESNILSAPPEFSDSYQNINKAVPIFRKKLKVNINKRTFEKYQKRKTNNETVEMLITSDEDVADEMEVNKTAVITNDYEMEIIQNKNDQTKNDLSKRSLRRTFIGKFNCEMNDNPVNYLSNVTSKNISLKDINRINNSSTNNLKFIAKNYSVQPIDLRKKRSSMKRYREIPKNSNRLNIESRRSLQKLNSSDFQNKIPLVSVFREFENYQSFSQVLGEKTNKSSFYCPTSHLHHDANQTEEYITDDLTLNNLQTREQHSERNITFPAPPSFLKGNKENSTLPILDPENILQCTNNLNPSNKRVSRYYKFLVENEADKNRKRSHSALDLPNSKYRDEVNEIQFESNYNSDSNNRLNELDFPLPPAEAYDRPNKIIIDIPENSSNYTSSYFKSDKRRKSFRNRNDYELQIGSSSSTSSPESRKIIKKNYRSLTKYKSMSSFEENQPQQNHLEITHGHGNSSSSLNSTTTLKTFPGFPNQLNEDTDHIYDNSQAVNNIWKESIKQKNEQKGNQKKSQKTKKVKTKSNTDSLKDTYLNITEHVAQRNVRLSLNQTKNETRRKLYNKGKSDSENALEEDNNALDGVENLSTWSLKSNDNTKINNQKTNNSQNNKKTRSDIIFNNVRKSFNSNEQSLKNQDVKLNSATQTATDDAIFKKPTLLTVKSNKKKLNKYSDNNSSNNININTKGDLTSIDTENDQSTNLKKLQKQKKLKNEVKKLMQNMPRGYKMFYNVESETINNENDESSTIRRSTRKPVPRRIFKYCKYYTNEYEVLPSLAQYNDIIKEQCKSIAKQKKIKDSEKKLKKNNNNKTLTNGKSKQNSKKDSGKSNSPNKKKSGKSVKKNKTNETHLIQVEEERNPDSERIALTVSPNFVEGVERENFNHFAEKQNNKVHNNNKKISTNKITKTNKEYKKNITHISNQNDLTDIVDSIKQSFNKFETTLMRANVGSESDNREITENVNSNIANTNVGDKLNSNKKLREINYKSSPKKKNFKNPKEPKNTVEILRKPQAETTANNKDIANNLNTTASPLSSNTSEKNLDLFHWVRQLACASDNNNDDIQRYFAENSFRITHLNKMQISEKDGVQYAFYSERYSKDFGYIKFKPGSTKSRSRSKSYDLHFLFIFGELEFHINDEIFYSKAGNFVTVPKNTYYSMVNSSSEPACLFHIKIAKEN